MAPDATSGRSPLPLTLRSCGRTQWPSRFCLRHRAVPARGEGMKRGFHATLNALAVTGSVVSANVGNPHCVPLLPRVRVLLTIFINRVYTTRPSFFGSINPCF